METIQLQKKCNFCEIHITLTTNFSYVMLRYPSVFFTFLLERHSSEQAAMLLVPALSNFILSQS